METVCVQVEEPVAGSNTTLRLGGIGNLLLVDGTVWERKEGGVTAHSQGLRGPAPAVTHGAALPPIWVS